MKLKRHYASTYKRAQDIQNLARQHYEPGRHDRSWFVVWRNYIYPQYGICFHTFLTLKNMDTASAQTQYPSLFPDY